MQKSKIITVLIIIFLFIYMLLSQGYFINLGNIYTFIIQPGFWIIVAVILKVFLLPIYQTKKLKKEIIEYVLITILAYVIIYLLSGLFVGFGKNPYATSVYGVFINLLVIGSTIVAKEYIRYRLLHNVYDKDKKTVGILLIILFTLVEFNIFSFIQQELNGYIIFKQLCYKLIPILIKNILFTYIAYKTDYIPNIVYEILMNIFLWTSPILPKGPWVLEAIIDTVFPILLLLYIRYIVHKKSRFSMERQIGERANPSGLIPVSIIVVLLIWFALGVFPIKPIGVATGSMEPNLNVGDVAIVKKCEPHEIEINDIIEYKMEGYDVIHRVIEIYQEDGEYIYITKGDNNTSKDKMPVSEDQLVGKVIFKIPYLALPSIWLHSFSSQVVVDVETGN